MSGSRARAAVGSLLREHGLWLTGVLTFVVFAAMLAYTDLGAIVSAFATFDWRFFAGVLGLALLGYGVRYLKWEFYLVELDIDVARRTSMLVFFSGLMMVVTPGKTGEMWKAWFLRDLEQVSVSRTASVVGAERLTDLLALSLLAAVGLAAYSRSSLVLLAVGSVFALGIGLLQWRAVCLRLLEWGGSLPVVGEYTDQLTEFYESTYTLFRPRPLLLAVGLSVVAWGLEGLALWLTLVGFGVEADILLGLFVFGLGSVIGAVSMLPGGLAATEASMVGLLVTFDYSQAVAVGATMIIRVGTLWFAAFLGFVVFTAYKVNSTLRWDMSTD